MSLNYQYYLQLYRQYPLNCQNHSSEYQKLANLHPNNIYQPMIYTILQSFLN